MAKVPFSKLKNKIEPEIIQVPLKDTDIVLDILTYLPQTMKATFVGFVVEHSIDQDTGCSSPLRLDTWFSIALAKYYGQITFTDKQLEDPGKVYDILQMNGVFNVIAGTIPEEEYTYIKNCTEQTAEDVARYNTSAAGIIGAMKDDSNSLNKQVEDIMKKIQNREGIDELLSIRDAITGKEPGRVN